VARERIAMSKVIEILRLRFGEKRSEREIALSIGAGKTTVHDIIIKAQAANVSWPLPDGWSESDARRALFPGLVGPTEAPRPLPEWGVVRKELLRKGVTLSLLWEEYKEEHPTGYGLSQFCDYYAKWEKTSRLVMRQEHRAGEKTFLDFSGLKIPWLDLATGEIREAEVFLAVLGASNYTFALAVEDQKLESWVQCHVEMNRFFGGTTQVWVPDNLKSAVTKACLYDPELNPTYRQLARHYGITVIPARSRKPKDKAKVETGVKIAQMWILARLRRQTFTSIGEINAAIGPLLAAMNDKKMRHVNMSRRALFDDIEKPTLRSLPETPFEISTWKSATVAPDYHVDAAFHYYSVPYQLVGQKVDVRVTRSTVEIFLCGKRVAAHRRSFVPYKRTTLPAHRPPHHRTRLEWTPERFVSWAQEHGPHTTAVIEILLSRSEHPEDAFRSCFATLRLGKKYGKEGLEAACEVAITQNVVRPRSLANILESGLHKSSNPRKAPAPHTATHENIRGTKYYN
jgi:transposase